MSEPKEKTPPEPTLEEALTRLEEIARILEQGDLPLEKSLALFEEGVALSRRLEARLSEAETKVEVLLRGEAGEDKVVPFDDRRETP